MVAHLHPQAAGHDHIEFLAAVPGQMDGLILQRLVIAVVDPVGLGQLLLELGGQVLDVNALLVGGDLALAPTGDGVG